MAKSKSALQADRDKTFTKYQFNIRNIPLSNSQKYKLTLNINNIMLIKNKLQTRD